MKDVIMHNLRDAIFLMKANVLQNLHICISVPFNINKPIFLRSKEIWH